MRGRWFALACCCLADLRAAFPSCFGTPSVKLTGSRTFLSLYTAKSQMHLFAAACYPAFPQPFVAQLLQRRRLFGRKLHLAPLVACRGVLWIEKFRCQNPNLNLPTIKNGFCGFSYPQDLLHIQNHIQAQFWDPWVMSVTWMCVDSARTQ